MVEISVRSNANVVAAAIERAGARVQTEVDKETKKYTRMPLVVVRTKVSGRPGPRRITGDFARSFSVRFIEEAS